MASIGGSGIKELARLNFDESENLKEQLREAGFKVCFDSPTFNEFVVESPPGFAAIYERLLAKKIVAGLPLARFYPEMSDHYLMCVTETISKEDIDTLVMEVQS